MTTQFGERKLNATDTMTLHGGEAVRVSTGTVFVFVIPEHGPHRGRRIPLRQLDVDQSIAGVAHPDAHLLVTGTPDTVIRIEPSEAVAEHEMMAEVSAALTQSDSRARLAAAAISLQEQHEQHVIDDAILSLVAAVPGDRALSAASADLARDAAVVDMLARQVGMHPDPLRLRRAVTDAEVTGRDPITALAAAAEASLRRVELPREWWRQEGPPLMVWTREDPEQVTAALWRRGHYRLWDPTDGLGAVVDNSVAGRLKHRAAVLEPLLDPTRPAGLGDLLQIGVRGSRHSMGLVVTLTAALGLLAAVIPIVTGSLTQAISSQTTSTLAVIGCALVALAAGNLLLGAVRAFALLRIRGRAVAITAAAVWDRMLRLPMTWHDRSTVASRMTDANAVDRASMLTPDTTIAALLDVALVAGAVIGVFAVDRALAFGLVGFLIVRGLVDYALIKRSARLTQEAVDASADSQSVVLEMVRGVNELRVSGATGRAFARWANVQATTTGQEVRQRRLAVVQQMMGVLWPTLGLALIFVITAVIGADVGELVTAQTALTAATSALGAAITAMGGLLAARAVLERAEAVMSNEPESGIGQEVAQLAGAIDLRDIVFRYRDDMPLVLDGLNLSVSPGSHVAIVGPSGCGKSTLIRLLLGLADPVSGVVSFDGRDLSGMDRAAIRRQIGTVMQSSQLLPGTIRDNVDLGRGLSTAEVWSALAMAAVAEDVRAMPMGLSTVVVDGASTISGGQRQRVLLARALAGRPRVLILDEATSALDNASQAAVVASLDNLDCTRLVVAHRLSTIERADQVVVLDQGRVVQQGTFQDLVAEEGPFRQLVERQRV